MADSEKEEGSGSFMETKGGPTIYIIVIVVGVWFIIWFGNYIPSGGTVGH